MSIPRPILKSKVNGRNRPPATHLLQCMLAVALIQGGAQGPAAEQPTAETPAAVQAPRVEVEAATIHVGTVVKGGVAEATFVLRNTGEAVLRILQAKPG